MADLNTDREALSFNGSFATDTTGVKVTYTAPDNRLTILRSVVYEEVPSHGATVDVELELRGGTKRVIEKLTVGVVRNLFVPLQGGDKVTFNVTVLAAGGNSEFTLGFEARGPNRNPASALGTVA